VAPLPVEADADAGELCAALLPEKSVVSSPEPQPRVSGRSERAGQAQRSKDFMG
jgi:hypothetical protein